MVKCKSRFRGFLGTNWDKKRVRYLSATYALTLDHSPTFVIRTLPSGCPRTDALSVNAVGNLAVLPRLLDAWTEVGVLQRDAVSIPARGIDNLSGRNGAVCVDPVAPPPT